VTDQVMDERIKSLEAEMTRKQNEVMLEMQRLRAKNESLERQLAEDRENKQRSPGQQLSLSPLSGVGDEPIENGTPRGKRHSKVPQRKAERWSILGDDPRSHRASLSGRRASISKQDIKERRKSVAHEALEPAQNSGEPQETGQIHSQRKWWAEQRQFLMEDLFPDGSPKKESSATKKRSSMGGQNDARLEGERQARASQMQPTVPEEPDAEAEEIAPPKAKNLALAFETAHENREDADEMPARMHRDSVQLSKDKDKTRMKTPQVYWDKNKDPRNSVGGVGRSSQN